MGGRVDMRPEVVCAVCNKVEDDAFRRLIYRFTVNR